MFKVRSIRLGFFVTALVVPSFASAAQVMFQSKITTLPSTIAGTLSPLYIAVNGNTVYFSTKSVVELKMNGQKVETKASPHSPFYFTSKETVFEFTEISRGKHRSIAKVSIDNLEKIAMTANSLSISLRTAPASASMDGRPAAISGKQATWKIADKGTFLRAPHSIEVVSANRAMRLYGLEFTSQPAVETPPVPEKPSIAPPMAEQTEDPRAVAAIQGHGSQLLDISSEAEKEMEMGLSKPEVEKVVKQHAREVRYCYEKALLTDPNIEGKMLVRFVINGAGVVENAVAKEETNDLGLNKCMVDHLKNWKFASSKNGQPTVVTYPFVFKSLTQE